MERPALKLFGSHLKEIYMKNTKAVLYAFLVLLVVTNAAPAQELDGTLKKIKDSGTLTLGYLESAPPFSFPGPDKRPVGYSIDLCMHVASAIQKQLGTNLKLAWEPVTTSNRIDMVTQGKVDIECGTTTASLARQERVDFSLMTFVDGGSLLTFGDVKFASVADLTGKRIAVIPGTTTESALSKFLKEEFVTVELVPVKDHVEGRAAIEKGAVDAFGLANLLFSYEPYGFMLRRNDAAFRLAVNRALAELYRSRGIAPIYDRWFGGFGKPTQAIQAMYLLNGLPE
jgi:ABC-type amino acid transport substrate-binding protein